MNTSVIGYTGSEMGFSEAEVDARHAAAEESQLASVSSLRANCCTDHGFRGSEMGLSEATLDMLHSEAAITRIQNIAKVGVQGICANCPKKSETSRASQIFQNQNDMGIDR